MPSSYVLKIKKFQKFSNESEILTIKFKNFIFFSVYCTNFYYDECALNYLVMKSNSFSDSNKIIHNCNILRVLKILYKLAIADKIADVKKQRQSMLQSRVNYNATNQKRYRNIFCLLTMYCCLVNENEHLEEMNKVLLNKLQSKKFESYLIDSKSEIKKCKSCLIISNKMQEIDGQYHSLLRKYVTIQIDKDRIVMLYAKSEKQLIDYKRLIDTIEKKLITAAEENLELRKKCEKVQDKVRKLNAEIYPKCSELMELRNRIEHLKIVENTKEMKLTWAQNRLKFMTNAVEELKWKLKESSEKYFKLKSHIEIFQLKRSEDEPDSFYRERRTQSSEGQYQDNQLDTKSGPNCKFPEKFDIINSNHGPKVSSLSEEIKVSTTRQPNSVNVDTELKYSVELLTQTLEQKSNDISHLEKQLSEQSLFQQILNSKEDRIHDMELTVQQLHTAIAELQMDLETYRCREVQTLEFIQKLTDKNIQLLHQNEKLQIKSITLEDYQIPLMENCEQLKLKIENLTSNLSIEKLKYSEENKAISKFIAEQTDFNEKLINQVEDLKGQKKILVKKYNFMLKEMMRQIHLHHIKSQNF